MAVDPDMVARVREEIRVMSNPSQQELNEAAAKVAIRTSEDTAESKYNIARVLCFSPLRKQQQEGVALVEWLLKQNYKPSETLFLASVAYYHLGKYWKCKECTASLVLSEPSNERAAALLEILKERIFAEGKKSLLILASIVAGLIAAYVIWNRASASPSVPDRRNVRAGPVGRAPLRSNLVAPRFGSK